MLRAIERKPVASLVEIGNNTLPVCGRVALQRAAASEGERVERVGWDFVRVGPSSNFGSSSSKSFGELSDQVSKVDHLVTLLDFFAKSEKLTI